MSLSEGLYTPISRRQFLSAAGTGVLALAMGDLYGFHGDPLKRSPNIVVILADDLGYADLGCQGCKDIPTPHCDSLAQGGVRFTNGYACHPVCAPSRAGLLTGRYQHRFGFEYNPGPEQYAAANFGLPRKETTLAESLKSAGYRTGMVGKWHVGFREGLRPHERGFDFHYGFLGGAHSYLPGGRTGESLVRNGEPVEDEKEYLTDAFAREACAFIERNKEHPFFLYVAFNAVHSPLEATKAYEARFSKIADGKRRTYAAMLAAMDDAVGSILRKLREHDLERDTLLFFYSDNGGPTPQTTSRNDPLRGYKGQIFEGGIRVPFLAQWKGMLPAGKVAHDMVMGFDVHKTALAAAGVALPAGMKLDGVNLLPYMLGERSAPPHDMLCWRSGSQHAVRLGDWKLLVTPNQTEPMLVQLTDDIGEKTDLAKENPSKVKELRAAFESWENQMMPPQWRRQDARTQTPASERGSSVAERFRSLDKNGDGKLTREEVTNRRVFDMLDLDDDGTVTLDEAKKALQGARGGDRDD